MNSTTPINLATFEFLPGDVILFRGRGLEALVIGVMTLPERFYWVMALAAAGLAWCGVRWDWLLLLATVAVVVAILVLPWFSHVGFVADRSDPLTGRPRLYESTTRCELPCAISGRVVRGGQAHDPAARIAGYAGRVYVMRLKTNERLSTLERSRLASCAVQHVGVDYTVLGAAISGTRVLRRFAADLELQRRLYKFCSYFTAHCLKGVRRFPLSIDSGFVSPSALYRILRATECYVDEARRLK